MSEFTKQEYILLIEALDRAATRQESEARQTFAHQVTAKYHENKAAAMHKLKSKILDRQETR